MTWLESVVAIRHCPIAILLYHTISIPELILTLVLFASLTAGGTSITIVHDHDVATRQGSGSRAPVRWGKCVVRLRMDWLVG